MAPRKPTTIKAPTLTPVDPTDLILTYLKTQNRPYSATDISSNLHNQVTKTKTDKLLKEMFERGDIGGRASGKSWVYWWSQDARDHATPEELVGLQSSIAGLREVVAGLKALIKSKTAVLVGLCEEPTTEALRASVRGLEGRREEIEGRLGVLRDGSVRPVVEGERERVLVEHGRWGRRATVRRKIWMEAEAMLLDGMTREELYDKLGIEEEV